MICSWQIHLVAIQLVNFSVLTQRFIGYFFQNFFFFQNKGKTTGPKCSSSFSPTQTRTQHMLFPGFGDSSSSQRQSSDSSETTSFVPGRSSTRPADFKTFRYFLSCFRSKANTARQFFSLNYRSPKHSFCVAVFISLTQSAILSQAASLNPNGGKCSQVPS